MRKNVREKELTSRQLAFLAHRTCSWWNAVFIQAERFLDTFENDNDGDPWDIITGAKQSFVAERMFLISAIYHAVELLEKLNIELNRVGDYSLQNVVNAIDKVAPLADIKNLRDMNEHYLDYLAELGQQKEMFETTAANWTILNGNSGVFRVGKIEIANLLMAMHEQLPLVRMKAKEVFETYFALDGFPSSYKF